MGMVHLSHYCPFGKRHLLLQNTLHHSTALFTFKYLNFAMKASWFAKEVGLTSNENDNKTKYILTKHYNVMVTPAESIRKKRKQKDRFVR